MINFKKIALGAISVLSALCLYMIAPSEAKVPDNIYTTKLPNGLDVIIVENHNVPLATVVIASKNGGYTEPPDYNGLSHFYEHMFFKGNAVIPNQEKFQERIRELGISYNGFTYKEAVVYFFTLPSEKMNDGLKFMNDAIRTPLFDEKEIEKEKGAVLGEYDRNESSPYFHLGRAVDQRAFSKYFSRVDVIGDRQVIKTVDKKKMEVIQKKFYVPNNCALLIVGDVNKEDALKKAKAMFGNWKKGEDPFKKYPIPVHPPIAKTESFIFNYPAKSSIIETKWHGPKVGQDDPATFALDVFFNALNLPSSKFQKALVESGLANSASMGYYTQKSSGEISLSANLQAEKVEQFKLNFLKELDKMSDTSYVTDEELDTAKKNIEISYLYSKEKTQDYGTSTLGFWWAVSGLDYYFNYVENTKKVTKKDIQAALKKYVFNKNYVMGLLVSKEAQEKNNIKF